MAPRISSIFRSGLRFCGRVPAVRQTYYVFEAEKHYVVLSFSRLRTRSGSGYFSLVDRKAVDFIRTKCGGYTNVTTRDVVTSAKRTRHVPTALSALNILYVLVGLGEAEIVDEGEHGKLYFWVYD